jgi:predicted transcriptional regulator
MNLAKLTPLEWEIMDTIWGIGAKTTVREVLGRAYPDKQKAYTTVQTIMNNLEKKKYLVKEKIGLVNFYKPGLKKNEIVGGETERFIKRVYRGSVKALISQLVDSDSLTQEEISDLRALIDRKQRSQK